MMQTSSSGEDSRLIRSPYELTAFVFCFLFAVAMVVNVQLAGDAEWFFYGDLIHRGVRLYADLHLPLQPFFVLETDAWLRIAGHKTLAYESLSLIHIFLFLYAMHLVLRESPWPAWRKAVLFVAAFFVNFYFVGIRFDDFHIICDICALLTIVVLLRLHRTGSPGNELWWSAAAGVLSGISFTDRSTEGAMLWLGAILCTPFLARRRRLASTAIVVFTGAAVILFIIHLTGDTYAAWASNSVLHAAASKGGNGSVFMTPLRAVPATFLGILHNKGTGWFLILLVTGALARRYGKDTPRFVLTAELCALPLVFALVFIHGMRKNIYNGAFIFSFNNLIQNFIYPLCLFVLYRFLASRRSAAQAGTRPPWDAREILILLAGTNLIAVAASQGIGTFNGDFPLVELLLLAHLWLPSGGRFRWLSDTWIAICVVLIVSGFVYKVHTPYSWGKEEKPMFEGREWYRHPVYGPMYIDTETLNFFRPLCAEMHAADAQPELLSMPYSYANFFCATPPWRNYVQTWFDTTEPDTVRTLEAQLDQAPPRWILYQRELETIKIHEKLYHHGQPIEHRHLDELIMGKLASGQWKLVDQKTYLQNEGWYLIETHP